MGSTNPFLVALLLALFAAAPLALSQECSAQGLQCYSSCCQSIGGTMSGSICNYPLEKEAQADACRNNCRATIIQCEAPSSTCQSVFSNCNRNCQTSGGANVSDCYDSCWGEATGCAESAKSGGCCGTGLVLFGAGLGGLMLARAF